MWASVLPLQAVKHIEQLHCFFYCWPSVFPENTGKDAQHKQTIQGQLSVGYSVKGDRSSCREKSTNTRVLMQYRVHQMLWSQSLCTISGLLVPMQRQNECHTWWFKLIQSVSASKGVMRSRRSSAWPIPFYEQLRTSQSGTAADRHGEFSLRGTEAICLYSGPVGKSHTVGAGQRKGKKGKSSN